MTAQYQHIENKLPPLLVILTILAFILAFAFILSHSGTGPTTNAPTRSPAESQTSSDDPLETLRNVPRDQAESGLVVMLTYNVICEGITPAASERAIAAVVKLAALSGVDITESATQDRIKRQGQIFVLGFELGMLQKAEHCRDLYRTVARLESMLNSK